MRVFFFLLDPNVFVITSLSALFELRLAFYFNFYAASFYAASSFVSFQIVISGVSACSERKLSLQ